MSSNTGIILNGIGIIEKTTAPDISEETGICCCFMLFTIFNAILYRIKLGDKSLIRMICMLC